MPGWERDVCVTQVVIEQDIECGLAWRFSLIVSWVVRHLPSWASVPSDAATQPSQAEFSEERTA